MIRTGNIVSALFGFFLVTLSLLLAGCVVDSKSCSQKNHINTQVCLLKLILLDDKVVVHCPQSLHFRGALISYLEIANKL